MIWLITFTVFKMLIIIEYKKDAYTSTYAIAYLDK